MGGIMSIRGKPYATVAHRAAQAHGEAIRPTGITSTVTRFQTIGDYHVVTVVVTFADGRLFEGSSEISRGSGGGAQGSSPVETAETSAYGRALAMAGWFGSGDGLAGYEEVMIAEARNPRVAPQPSRNGTAQMRPVANVAEASEF
jgi:hypothetical protein